MLWAKAKLQGDWQPRHSRSSALWASLFILFFNYETLLSGISALTSNEQSKHKYTCIVNTFTHCWFAIRDIHSCSKMALAMHKVKQQFPSRKGSLLYGTWPQLPREAQEIRKFILNNVEKRSHGKRSIKTDNIAKNEGRPSAHTQHSYSKDREKTFRTWQVTMVLWSFSSLGYQTASRDWRGVKTNVIEQYEKGEKNNSRARTESSEKHREGIMWDVMSTRRAERGMGDRETENNRRKRTETQEHVHQSTICLLCTE